ncbi:MAG: hypothetical protein WB786_03170 [Thermoplasmata archaeon]
MSALAPSAARWRVRPWSLALLLVTLTYLGYLSGYPYGYGFLVAAGAVALAAFLRASPSGSDVAYAPAPVLAVLALEAVAAPVGFGTELFAGFAALAFLVWLADDPDRPSGGPVRSLPTIAVPALALGIAWVSGIILPAGALPLGVAGGLLALALAAVAYLVGSPSLFDREEA